MLLFVISSNFSNMINDRIIITSNNNNNNFLLQQLPEDCRRRRTKRSETKAAEGNAQRFLFVSMTFFVALLSRCRSSYVCLGSKSDEK